MRTAAPLPNQARRPLLLRQQRPGDGETAVPAPAGPAPSPRAAGNDPGLGSPEPNAAQCRDVAGSNGVRPGRDGCVAPPQGRAGPGTATFGVSDDCLIYFTATPVSSVPDPTLFSWDIGPILLQKTAEKEDELKKAFQMLDVGQTLTVTKGEFRRVIETFLFHLTEAEFDAVLAEDSSMYTEMQIPNIGKVTVPYLDFLSKFTKIARSTSMLKRLNSHSCQTMTLSQLESLLEEKLCSAYQDIEKAFRAIDVSQSGFVSLDYLKSVINGFIFPLPNETFQELMNRVNPARGDEAFSSDTVLQKLCRYIQDAYPTLKQAFLMLDEKRDGKITRNDLRHVLRNLIFQVKDKDFQELIEIIDPEQTGYLDFHEFLDLFEEKESVVEDILSDKITENWKDFHKALQSYDPKCTGTINRSHLRKVLQLCCPSLTEQQFMNFFAYNKQSHGKINKASLRKVLEDHGMPMDDNQFNLLTEKLGLPDGGLSYLDFVAILKDARLNGPGATLCNSPNHRVNDAKYHYMTAEECLSQLYDELMEVYGDTYSAFRETDSNHDGIINMLDFQQFLDSFLLRLRDEEFLCLLCLFGMNLTSVLNYQEFCQLFHAQETKEVPPRLVPSHNITVGSDVSNIYLLEKKQMITDAELACDHAHHYLVIKARARWHDLARNFQEFDSEGNGVIQPRDLKKVLFRFGIPITLEEFKQLWARYDTDAKGYLTHQEFLQKLGIEFAPADAGLSRHITEGSYARLQAHYNNQQKKHSKLEEQQKQQTKALHVREIKKQIKDKFRDYFQVFNKAFHKVDKNRDGYVTVCDLHRILQEFSYYLDHDHFSSLLNRVNCNDRDVLGGLSSTSASANQSLGISIHDSKLSCFDFLRATDDGRASKYQQRQKQAAPPASFAVLSLEQTLIKIKEIVASSYGSLYKAFSLFDKEDTGVIKALEFQQVLDHFCFKLSDKQFRHLLKNLKHCEDFTVDWKVFLKNINHLIETEEGQKVVPPKSSWELSERGILSQIQEVVTASFNTIAQEFKDIDSSKDNTVSKEEFWDIGNRHFQHLTEEQFENLWNTVDVSAGGRLKFQDFLKKFSSELVTMPSSTPSATSSATSTKPATCAMQEPRVSSRPERPKTSSSLLGQKSIPASSHPQTTTTCSAPILNCETIENKIRKNIQHSWRGILKVCQEKDVSKLGEILVSDFLDIAEKFNLDLSEGEINQITTKYDLKKNGRFAYYDFLQSSILLLKPQESSLLQRVIIQKPQKPMSPGPQTTSFFSAMLRIQPQILCCWRPMKRTFKSCDESHTGLLHIADFRQVLHEYSIDLTEEELFNILEYYDKTLSSKISYNDFLQAFIQ
ncbi:EF-hand calcium-binding domain-containing protein 6 [Aptenodytes patagonicus]|uniref:EF-hand calcium-binding domain-containing protein 6 n=1 Tax=Aptenodytes patagonicus TaxID=9234 RepID=UPI003F9F20EE